jgi:hypothetical protein
VPAQFASSNFGTYKEFFLELVNVFCNFCIILLFAELIRVWIIGDYPREVMNFFDKSSWEPNELALEVRVSLVWESKAGFTI